MPAAFALVLGRILAWVGASLIFKIFTSLGVGFVVITGVTALINAAFTEIQSLTSGAPAQVVAILGMLRIDDAITVLAGAVAVRLSLKTLGVGGGGIRQLVFGKPAGSGEA